MGTTKSLKGMSGKTWLWAGAILILLAGVLLVVFGLGSEDEGQKRGAGTESPVVVQKVSLYLFADIIEAIGTARANESVTITAQISDTVKEVHLRNPHSWVYVEVMDAAGQPGIWVLEAKGVTALAGLGVTEANIDVGDTISARCHRLRDGSKGCLLGFLTSADGVEREWD